MGKQVCWHWLLHGVPDVGLNDALDPPPVLSEFRLLTVTANLELPSDIESRTFE